MSFVDQLATPIAPAVTKKTPPPTRPTTAAPDVHERTTTVALPPFIVPRVDEAFAPMPDVVGWLNYGQTAHAADGESLARSISASNGCSTSSAPRRAWSMFAPIMLTTYAVLFVTTRGKPIFRQERVGHCGKLFPMFKFRTMRLDAHKMQAAGEERKRRPDLQEPPRPADHPLGRILRSTSIDEMPQLFNVLLGHMSLVGPRPPIASEVAQYEAWQFGRLSA